MAVLLVGILTPALIQAAIEQEAFSAGLNQVHGPGDGPGGAPKCYFHYPSERVMVSDNYRPGVWRLLVTENTPETVFARTPARFLSVALSTTPTRVTFPFATMMWMGGTVI